MFQVLLSFFLALLSIFSGVYAIYFTYVRSRARRPWQLEFDRNFKPEISILVAAHNEENTVESKLGNIRDVLYPKEKVEIILVDDASEDKTLLKAKDFAEDNPQLNIKVLEQNPRAGKSAALNKALAASMHSIVIVSDADTSWPSDMLQNALPYLADSKIGAVTGFGLNRNIDQSWVTKAEGSYLRFANLLRLGESKIHSTIRFEGGFCAYKKEAFEKFDCETGADDSGTALEVVQHNYRTILAPEAAFYTWFPTGLKGKLKTKTRRATQLISLWVKCFKLLLEKRLLLPKKIAIPEILLFILAPLVLCALFMTTMVTVILFPFSLFSLAILILIGGMLMLLRETFLEVLIDNLILLYALTTFVLGRRYITWEKA